MKSRYYYSILVSVAAWSNDLTNPFGPATSAFCDPPGMPSTLDQPGCGTSSAVHSVQASTIPGRE